MKQRKLFAVASGSGGHILPALIAAKAWHTKNQENPVIFCTGISALDKKILSEYAFLSSIRHFSIDKFSPKKFWLYPKILIQVIWACIKSFGLVIRHKPTTILSTGGLIAIPLCLAGRMLGSRIEIYELNVIPGKAVKALMPLAHVIYTPFAATKKHCHLFGCNFERKCQFCHYPIRFTEEDRRIPITNIPNFQNNKKTIFLLGGSQGSRILNNALKAFLLQAQQQTLDSIQVIHQTGKLDDFDWAAFYKKLNIPALTFSYHEKVRDFYNQADLIICRAGAGTIFEVAFFQKQCIVIPLVASTTAHQVENAREIAHQHPDLFTMIAQSTVTSQPTVLYHAIMEKLEISK